jgi:hypothetical protein
VRRGRLWLGAVIVLAAVLAAVLAPELSALITDRRFRLGLSSGFSLVRYRSKR